LIPNKIQGGLMNNFMISMFPVKSRNGLQLAYDVFLLLLRRAGISYDQTITSGAVLYEQYNEILQKTGVCFKIYDRFVSDIGQNDFMNSCLNDDIVIFDASREGECNSINNYDIANEWPKTIEYIWVVSRTYLPVNFYGMDAGGSPDYKTGIKKNSEILAWIDMKLCTIKEFVPRSAKEKNIKSLMTFVEESVDTTNERKNRECKIFISFLTKYEYRDTIQLKGTSFEKLTSVISAEKSDRLEVLSNRLFNDDSNDFRNAVFTCIPEITENEYADIHTAAIRNNFIQNNNYTFSAAELAERINQGKYHNGIPKSVKFLEDGSLVFSTELNTKERMWQLLSIIDNDYISPADELWIYGSFDYLNSWWTRGELLIYAYITASKIDRRKSDVQRKLMLYDPVKDTAQEIHLPELDEKFVKRLARIYSNCNPGGMGYESVKSLRMLSNILYGTDDEKRDTLDEYCDIYIKAMLPVMLQEKNICEKDIQKIVNDEDTKSEFKKLLEPFYKDLAEQASTGKYKPETRKFMKQVFDGQYVNMPEEMKKEISFDDFFKTSFSREYLCDPVFQSDFWETVILFEAGDADICSIEELIKKISGLNTEDIFDFKDPPHVIAGSVNDISEGKIKNINGYRLLKRPSRYIFMPTRGGCIDISPGGNNLQELPVFIVEY
jgi:hypothetical protein